MDKNMTGGDTVKEVRFLCLFLLVMLLNPVIAVKAHASEIMINSGLVAYYSFDNIHGNILKDDSGNGHDGVIYGNPKVVEGIKGKALEFDGIDDYVKLSDDPFDLQTFTIALWIKPEQYGYQTTVCKHVATKYNINSFHCGGE